jgi:hypothetical protein
MAALGDSITRAFDVCCFYGDHPGNSWSTGGSRLDRIQSHYERLRARSPAIGGHQFNDAVTGAKMSAGPGQAAMAVAQGAQYVTILLGANDLCTSSVATIPTRQPGWSGGSPGSASRCSPSPTPTRSVRRSPPARWS